MKKFWVEAVFVVLGITLIAWIFLRKQEPELKEVVIEQKADPVLKFGLPVDSFYIEQGSIRRNQNLSDILTAQGISYQTIDQIARKSRPIFDLRKMKQGNNYYFFCTPDSNRLPRYFVYELDQVEAVVYQLTDNLDITKSIKPVIKEIRTASGVINSSLWNTIKDNNLNPMLAVQLSDIYAWTIDFFGIQKGDKFRVIYEESFVDSVSIGTGQVFACQFDHGNVSFYAFQFEQDSILSYFNDKGESLKKAFLKAPLKFSRISSGFTNARHHPVLKITRPHHGVDYAAPTGTPVMTIGDGVVTKKAYQGSGAGNYLYIKHNSVYTTCYMHLNSYAKGIAAGTRVRQGQIIGYVGKTGLATGPHLDFRVFKNGSPINPLKVEAPPVEPVHQQNLARYNQLKDSLTLRLIDIPYNFEKKKKDILHL
ncbi:MAG: peptidoglycan DD-metalloendopeptidase family protein [Mangrovibacterium sp.]